MSSDKHSTEIEEIFRHWQTQLNHPQAKLTKDRIALIRARLKEGYTAGEIIRAVDGCAASSFHTGANERGQRYDDLTLICRSGSKLESFISLSALKQTSSAPLSRPTISTIDEIERMKRAQGAQC